MDRSYFIIDGSHLLASILALWRMRLEFKNKKLNIDLLTRALMRNWSLYTGATTRVIYYFKENEDRVHRMLIVPKSEIPGLKDHWQIKFYGKSLKALPESQRQRLSPQYRDYFPRSEKGLDIKLACDSLVLASSGKASNIVFLVNDRDFIPLFEAIQYFGVNTYLTALDSKQKIGKELSTFCDKYITLDNDLENIFGIVKQPQAEQILQQNSDQSIGTVNS